MTSEQSFDFDFESDVELFDPLSDSDFEEDDFDAPLESGNSPADPEDFPSIESLSEHSEEVEQQPPEQRTALLLDQMQTQRNVLLPILDFCREKHPDSEVVALIEELQKDNRSVFSPDNLCLLLERAGALERVTNDGDAVGDTLVEPNRIVVDGTEYYEPAPVIDTFWFTTEAGRAALDAYKPDELIRQTLESEPEYSTIYRRILEAAALDNGVTRNELSKSYSNKPVVESPRLYVEHFIDRLSKAGAIEWKNKAWHISDVGKDCFGILEEIDAKKGMAASDAATDSDVTTASERLDAAGCDQ